MLRRRTNCQQMATRSTASRDRKRTARGKSGRHAIPAARGGVLLHAGVLGVIALDGAGMVAGDDGRNELIERARVGMGPSRKLINQMPARGFPRPPAIAPAAWRTTQTAGFRAPAAPAGT